MYLGFAASFSLHPVWITKAGRLRAWCTCAFCQYFHIIWRADT